MLLASKLSNSYNNNKNEKISKTKTQKIHHTIWQVKFLCHHCTTNVDKLDWNSNVIVILISDIVPSSSKHCDLDFVGDTHKETEG